MARILFVDDDPFTLETLTKAVEVFGHQALLADNGTTGFELAVGQAPDLIFTDMRLPDMDGLAFVQKLQTHPQTKIIPVLVLSASPVLDAIEMAKAAGAKDYINKPIRLQALLDIIQKYTAP
jgi:CheY-like chemotaxis protein